MAKIQALALTLFLGGLFSLGASAAWADGYRLVGWRYGGPYFGGQRFWGPSYEGPRYDGPPDYDVEGVPPVGPPGGRAGGPPGGPPDERVGMPAGSPPPGPRKCYTSAETRERVVSANLREPFALMRKASAMTQAEALAGKLCRWNDQDIYEISLLRRDGMLIHVYMNAATGQPVGAPNAH